MAGEIYTTFTFLGGSGYAYGHGGPVLYILSYACLAYILSYWMLPPIWRYAKQHRLISQPDFFARKYDSRALGVLVSMVGVVALIPYMVLQLKGLGIIVSVASYGTISPDLAVWIGATVVTIYVITSGIHGSAWNAVVKDVLILGVVLFLGIYLPIHFYGSYRGHVRRDPDGEARIHGSSRAWRKHCLVRFDCTAHGARLLHVAAYVRLGLHGPRRAVFRKNAAFLPIYQLILLFVFFAGFAAILKVPGLTGPDIDLSLFRLSLQAFDPWFIGVIGAAGALTALVPGSMI